jgi:DNA-binding response OmpR family regulator
MQKDIQEMTNHDTRTTSGSILIIDDEVNLRNTLTRILQKIGCTVTNAAKGAEGLKILSTTRFDLIFLDLRLPDIHGIELLRQIRQLDQQVSVIVLTGHGSINSAVEALHLEATDYLLKPINPEILITRTVEILDNIKKNRRRKEIQEEISKLQAELASINSDQRELDSLDNLQDDTRYINLGRLQLDIQTRRVTLDSSFLDIPPSSFEYLVVLARHTPDVVSYQNLVREAQGYDADYTEARNLTRWHIHVLRQALENDSDSPKFIFNKRGEGYLLSSD